MDELILQYGIREICAKLDSGEKKLVEDVSFEISAGESLALIGETGSGKTMTAQSIMGTLPRNVRTEGASILLCGQPLPAGRKLRAMLGREIVYVPQNGHEFLNPSRTVWKHMVDGLKRMDCPVSERRAEACRLLALAGFDTPEEILQKYPFQLSGGMAQRVTIALALCSNAKLLIADEPTNGLDQTAKQRFLGLMDNLFPTAAKLVITHDISVAALCDRILVLCGGKSMETGPSSDVLKFPDSPYTKALLGALVENGMVETPVLRKSEGDCPFYGRCPQARRCCRSERIPQNIRGKKEWRCACS